MAFGAGRFGCGCAFVFAAYWGVFKLFAGASVGAQLARSAESAEQ